MTCQIECACVNQASDGGAKPLGEARIAKAQSAPVPGWMDLSTLFHLLTHVLVGRQLWETYPSGHFLASTGRPDTRGSDTNQAA